MPSVRSTPATVSDCVGGWGSPADRWIVFFWRKSIYKWMMNRGTPMTFRKPPNFIKFHHPKIMLRRPELRIGGLPSKAPRLVIRQESQDHGQ